MQIVEYLANTKPRHVACCGRWKVGVIKVPNDAPGMAANFDNLSNRSKERVKRSG